jgi:hypothetical protein
MGSVLISLLNGFLCSSTKHHSVPMPSMGHGASKEGLSLHSQAVQAIRAEYCNAAQNILVRGLREIEKEKSASAASRSLNVLKFVDITNENLGFSCRRYLLQETDA